MKKPKCRVRNWSKYNASLKKQGSGAIWISPEAVENWTTGELTGKLGASPTYTDLAIETVGSMQTQRPNPMCVGTFICTGLNKITQ
jgi:Transposase DDE domain